MTITTVAPAIFAFAGALAYVFATNPKTAELGRIAFAVALLVVLFGAAGYSVRIG